MNKELFLVRHAKSDWKDRSLSDIDRPLNKRGIRDAPLMAERLKKKGVHPDLIISSPARRARMTAEVFADILGYNKENIWIEPAIYHGGQAGILKTLTQVPSTDRTVLLFGHNPDLTDLAGRLAGVSIINIPTCGIVRIDFGIAGWADLSPEHGRLIFFDYPKNME
ncbi:MAG: histidine phosphatase family protein [Acidobacteria bacterium]|nr:histidine phosphatase family protein [Acidobacteriota bacterium]MBU1474842.1 histidine phosphatase family protein [Acidobacteriota bacterium]MBU4331083.1 histidine phosphatase family protein [Acidobacteriota bacterium]MBU4496185.1 histidine phosphatase family protein [Acidobacteriota bacterium]MCG2816343.1 histidine phosphatase family protein [Candidatus Aminicenantes bacterium]